MARIHIQVDTFTVLLNVQHDVFEWTLLLLLLLLLLIYSCLLGIRWRSSNKSRSLTGDQSVLPQHFANDVHSAH
jgi:hypothetical protein